MRRSLIALLLVLGPMKVVAGDANQFRICSIASYFTGDINIYGALSTQLMIERFSSGPESKVDEMCMAEFRESMRLRARIEETNPRGEFQTLSENEKRIVGAARAFQRKVNDFIIDGARLNNFWWLRGRGRV